MDEKAENLAFDWDEAGRTCGCSKKQIAFVRALVEQHASQGQAARIAGYSASGDHGYRSQGSAAAASSKVRSLLALAEAGNAGMPVDLLTPLEAKKILSQMARKGDANSKIRAISALTSMEAAEREAGQAQQSDGFPTERMARDFILDNRNGAVAFALLMSGHSLAISRLPLFWDIAPAVMRDWPDVWAKLVERQSETMKLDLRERLADPGWQKYARQKIWGEVGWIIDKDDVAKPDPEGRKFIKPTAQSPGEAPVLNTEKANGSTRPEAT